MTLELRSWRKLRSAGIKAAKQSPLRYLAAPAYAVAVRAELAVERARDTRLAPIDVELNDVTALVKTFERPRTVDRLIRSVGRSYPNLPVLVVDDSRSPKIVDAPRVKALVLPYDVGLAEGRNLGLAAIESEFFLLLDDDFVLTRRTGLEGAMESMRRHPEIDIMGGQIFNLPTYERGLSPENRGCFGGATGTAEIGGLPRYDRVTNFFLGRRERVQSIGWDPQLKLVEHSDFFRRAHGKLVTVFNGGLRCLHAMTPFDVEYMKKREDVAPYLARLREKWGR